MANLLDFTNTEKWDRPHKIIECKKALSPSKLPDIDYALNPYGGCEHGCIYCYAPELTHTSWDEWRVVKVRMGIDSRLGKEMESIDGVIGIGTTTDPYQPAEERFELTRKCLLRIRKRDLPIHLHTKSDLILRDADILSDLKGMIAITVTTVDDRISMMTEPGAPLPGRRLKALKELTESGMNTYALVGPILTNLEGKEEEFVSRIADTGVKLIYLDLLNDRPLLRERTARHNMYPSPKAKETIRTMARSAGMDVRNVFD